ncbi:MAG: hypothetical protein J5750_01275, partial [Clostridiales bacterium]|nr:hypothetical protein [Clostridiales bacterium]
PPRPSRPTFDPAKSVILAAKHEKEYQEIRRAFGLKLGNAIHQVAKIKIDAVMEDINRRLQELEEWEKKQESPEANDPETPDTSEKPKTGKTAAASVEGKPELISKKPRIPRKKALRKTEAEKKEAAKKAAEKKEAAKKASPAGKKPVSKRKETEMAPPPDPASPSGTKLGLLIDFEITSHEEFRVFITLCRDCSISEPTMRNDKQIEVFFTSFKEMSDFSLKVSKITSGVRSMTLRRY